MNQKVTVLIADDEQAIRTGLKAIVTRMLDQALVVSCVGTGQQALEDLRRFRPDIAIVDINMPDVDGLELSRYLFENCPDTRMILISGHSEFEYAQRALQYHVTDYILKPITRAKLNSLEERLIAIQSELSADVRRGTPGMKACGCVSARRFTRGIWPQWANC